MGSTEKKVKGGDPMDQVIQYGLNNDMIFLVLFVLSVGGLTWLVRWILKTNDEREQRYIDTIDKLSDSFEGIKGSVERIERKIGL